MMHYTMPPCIVFYEDNDTIEGGGLVLSQICLIAIVNTAGKRPFCYPVRSYPNKSLRPSCMLVNARFVTWLGVNRIRDRDPNAKEPR